MSASTAEFVILSVDDGPGERLHKAFGDIVPYALLKPGTHVLRVRQLVPKGGPEKVFNLGCQLEAGKGYGITTNEGEISLFEEPSS